MRAPRIKTVTKSGNPCIDYNIQPTWYPELPLRITRSLKKLIDDFHDFIILENYRCMPLLGDEEKIPNWDVHIVHYTIVYVTKKDVEEN